MPECAQDVYEGRKLPSDLPEPLSEQPLAKLDIPAASASSPAIHESLSATGRSAAQADGNQAGREVDVAAACGLGWRPDVSQAWDRWERRCSWSRAHRPDVRAPTVGARPGPPPALPAGAAPPARRYPSLAALRSITRPHRSATSG